MSYFYIKSGGSATGDSGRYASQQSGSFATLGAANYYDNINAAMGATTAPTSGDFLCISDASTYSSSSDNIGIISATVTSGGYLYLVSVDDTNCDQYKKATSAQETNTSTTFDVRMYGRVAVFGVYLKSSDDIVWGAGHNVIAYNCSLEVTGTGDRPCSMQVDGSGFTGVNCTYIGVSGSIVFGLTSGSTVNVSGGDIVGATILTNGGFGNGGGSLVAHGLDASAVSDTLVKTVGGSSVNDDAFRVELAGCQLHASVAFSDETFQDPNQELLVTNSASSSGAAEYQDHYETYGGEVDEDTAIYRDNSTAFPDSSQKTSLKVVTDANAAFAAPFTFKFPTRYAELSNTASDLIRLFILSSASLTDQDVWATASYPDGTTKHLYNFLTTGSGDPFATGTTLSTNTEAWTGRTAENRYQIDLDTNPAPGPGADCVPIIRVYVAKASATIYFDTTVDLV